MRSFFVAAFLLISFGTFAQSKEAEIWSQVENLTKAIFETKDSKVLNDLVSEHVTYGHSSGVLENKQEMVNNATSSKTMYKNISFERVSIDADRKTALVRHNFRATTVDVNGGESPLDLGILQVWKKENGKWRIWARQAFKINPKK